MLYQDPVSRGEISASVQVPGGGRMMPVREPATSGPTSYSVIPGSSSSMTRISGFRTQGGRALAASSCSRCASWLSDHWLSQESEFFHNAMPPVIRTITSARSKAALRYDPSGGEANPTTTRKSAANRKTNVHHCPVGSAPQDQSAARKGSRATTMALRNPLLSANTAFFASTVQPAVLFFFRASRRRRMVQSPAPTYTILFVYRKNRYISAKSVTAPTAMAVHIGGTPVKASTTMIMTAGATRTSIFRMKRVVI